MSRPKVEVSSYQLAKWHALREGFESVKVHFSHEIRSMENRIRFTCKRHYGFHGTFLQTIRETVEHEAEGRSACPMCRAIDEAEEVAFKEFKSGVDEQRKILAKSAQKAQAALRRSQQAPLRDVL